MQPALTAAVIGTGFIGRIHVRAARLAGAQVAAVAASSAARGAEAAASLGVPRSYATALDAVRDSSIDVIHICTPNSLHLEVAEAALRAGKHVVCEKPLATTVADAQLLADLAASRGLVATVPFVNRYHPMVREARARVSNETGPLYLIQGSYLQDWLLQAEDTNWRVDSTAGGPSRAFADIGSHLCDLLEWITGDRFDSLIAVLGTPIAQRAAIEHQVTFQSAAKGARTGPVSTEDIACLIARTRGGVLASLAISQVSAGRKNRLWFEIDGAHQSIIFDQESPEELWIGRREGTTKLVRDPSQGSPEQRRLAYLPAGHAQGWADCFEAFVRDTYAAIRGEARDGLPTFADGARSMRIVDAVLRSSAERSWTSVSSN